MRYLFHRFCALVLALLVLCSAVPQLVLAAEDLPDPRCELGVFSGDMLDGGGCQVQTEHGLFYLGGTDGYIYNKAYGAAPVYDKPAARLNYADGVLYFARIGEESFDLCALDLATRQETVLLEHFSGAIGQLYLVDRERLEFLCDHAVWELDLATGEYRLIFHDPELWSFVPTACGPVYALGSLFDYSIYAGSRLIAEHADSYYVDFDLGKGLLVFTVDGADCQMNLAEAFAGLGEIQEFAGRGETAAEGIRGISNRDEEGEAALRREDEEAEALDALNAGILNQDVNLPPLLEPARDDFLDQPEPVWEQPADAEQDPMAPQNEETADPEFPEDTDPELPEETDAEIPEQTEAVIPEENNVELPEIPQGPLDPDRTEPVQVEMPDWMKPSEEDPAQPEEEPIEEETDPANPVNPVENETDPVNPVENETDPVNPAENETEPADPAENETDPVNPAENETDPADPAENETDPADPAEDETDPAEGPEDEAEPAVTEFRRAACEGVENIVRRARQMLNVRWTPRKRITGWGGRYSYEPGVTYTGLPYGQPVNAAYVPWNADLEAFVNAVNSPDSEMYTRQSTFNKVAPYYSVDCSGFVSWAWDLPCRCTTASLNGYAKLVSSTTYSGIQVGDMLNDVTSHTVLVTDVVYNGQGVITGIEISEATPTTKYYGCCRSTWYTGSDGLAAFRSNYLGRGYAIYRSKTRDSVSYTHSCVAAQEQDTCRRCGLGMFLQPGVDVSTWQGVIDWDTAADYLSFAILRIGYGVGHLDTQFENNVRGCEANDLPYGIYLYGLATTPEEARKEALFVIDSLGSHYPELPVFYDVEEPKGNLALSKSELLAVVSAFCETIEDAGYQAGVYCSTFWWDYKLTAPEYNNWCRWVAQHYTVLTAEDGGNLWQYTDQGHVPGISTNVDLNYWFGPVGGTEHRFRSVEKAPTCTEDGKEGYVCVACGKEAVEIIPAPGHDYADEICRVCGAVKSPLENYKDVDPDAWYAEAVEFVLRNNLFQGITPTAFAPDAPMDRAMMATVLWRLAGAPENGVRDIFTDVNSGAWFAEAVTWAAENDVALGTSLVTFSPHDTVNREQAVTFLCRAAQRMGLDCESRTELFRFPDAMQTSTFARDSFSWATAEGLVNGSNTVKGLLLQPRKAATRAEVAAMIMRLAQLLENP